MQFSSTRKEVMAKV